MNSPRRLVEAHPLGAFFGLAYLLAWAWWVPLAVSGRVVGDGQRWPTQAPGLLAPSVAAVTVTAVVGGRVGLRDLGRRALLWRVAPFWYAVVAAPLLLY